MAKKRDYWQPEVKAATEKPQMEPKAEAVEPMKIHFDAWWAMNEKKIPVQHRKEIVKADFKARGLSLMESIQTYNEGLKKYGLKLK